MLDFTKLAAFLDSFEKDDPSYDTVAFIKEKIAEDLRDSSTVNNADSDNLEDNDITMSTPDQQAESNYEGEIMDGAFKELDAMNKIKEDKEKIHMPGEKDENGNTKLDVDNEKSFGDAVKNQKQATLYTLLKRKLAN